MNDFTDASELCYIPALRAATQAQVRAAMRAAVGEDHDATA